MACVAFYPLHIVGVSVMFTRMDAEVNAEKIFLQMKCLIL